MARVSAHITALLPVAAAIFAAPQFVPQLVRVRRYGATAGVSWTWAAMTCVNNAAWVAYFAQSRFYSALIPAAATILFAGLLTTQLTKLQSLPRGPALAVTGWALGLAAAGAGYGRIGLGTALAAAFLLQVTPSVWTAYRTQNLAGVSVGTWLLIFGELACFGLFGLAQADPRLTMLGGSGVAASFLMLTRVAWLRWRQRSTSQGDVIKPAELPCSAPASWATAPYSTKGLTMARPSRTVPVFNRSVEEAMDERQLDRAFAALADPTRRDMIARLTVGDAAVGALAANYEMSLQAVSKHLKVLEAAGLVTRSKDAQKRPVHLEAGVLDLMTGWIERYRRQVEQRYQRLDSLLAELDGRTDEGKAS